MSFFRLLRNNGSYRKQSVRTCRECFSARCLHDLYYRVANWCSSTVSHRWCSAHWCYGWAFPYPKHILARCRIFLRSFPWCCGRIARGCSIRRWGFRSHFLIVPFVQLYRRVGWGIVGLHLSVLPYAKVDRRQPTFFEYYRWGFACRRRLNWGLRVFPQLFWHRTGWYRNSSLRYYLRLCRFHR